MHGRISRDDSNRLRRPSGLHAQPRLAQRHVSGGLVAAIAAAHVGLAAWFAMTASPGSGTPLRSIAIVLFLGLAACFCVVAYRIAAARNTGPHAVPLRHRAYWQACGACLVICYALGLVVGSDPTAAYVFWTSLALCHAAAWFLLSGSPEGPRFVTLLFRRRPLRAAASTLYLVLMVCLAGELGLRVYAFALDDSLMTRYVTDLLKLPPGGDRLGQTVNSQGYWDDEFPVGHLRSGLRVAALGDETLLCGDADSNFLAQVERLMPGVEVLNFGVPRTSPREYTAQLETTVAACRPDVVLVCISIASDITDAPQLPGAFDWRGLHLVQRSLGLARPEGGCGEEDSDCSAASSEPAGSECLDEAARELEVCRVPVKEPLQARWRSVFQHLDSLLRRCRDEGIEPMLVVLPCEFQVDDRLRQTLCRRAGYRSDQIDIDLPQRRLAAYAKDRRIQMLDLMPHLRATRRPSYRCDAAHFNKHGNSVAAVVLGEWLESQYGSTLLASGS